MSIIAAITALGAALLAVVQNDIKRVLAYSTLSQLAYMIAGLSMGPEGVTAGFFHLFTHAFFKALLFLGAGSLIHAVHSNNMSDMGGLRKKMPITFWTMLFGSLALAGIFPLAGFWSKDELLVVANETHHTWLFVVFLLTAVITAFYTARMVLLTFFGEYKGHAHPHESPPSMTGPLIFLAICTAGAGLLGAPQLNAVFGQWVFFEAIHEAVFVPWIAVLSTVGAVLGLLAGYALYKDRKAEDPEGTARSGLDHAGEPVLHRRLLHAGDRLPGPRRRVGGRLLVQPERARRVVNGAAASLRVWRRRDVVRPERDRRHRQRLRPHGGQDRRRAEVPADRQRAVVRGRTVRGRARPGHRLHQIV